MPVTDLWNHLQPADWADFARKWMEELRQGNPPANETEMDDESFSSRVVLMNFTASPEQQWQFILHAVAAATNDDELSCIAAGPIEHLLGHHDPYIDHVERRAALDPRFARAVTYVAKYMMSDEPWARVQAIQSKAVASPHRDETSQDA